jgi:hypothetical protein
VRVIAAAGRTQLARAARHCPTDSLISKREIRACASPGGSLS